MIEHATKLMESIKKMYIVNYSDSRRQIEDFELVHVPVPSQVDRLVSRLDLYAYNFILFLYNHLYYVCLFTVYFLFFNTDCGLFMLKNLELWNGRVVPCISQDMMPGIMLELCPR